VGSEYFINSQELEDKVRNLLPSQGGAGAGFDLSASTQIIPIIDLTESAEGSNVRQDLQTAISFDSSTTFLVQGATSTIISNTGYFRVFGNFGAVNSAGAGYYGAFILNDGATDKELGRYLAQNGTGQGPIGYIFDFTVKLKAGDILKCISSASQVVLSGVTRQIADIDGVLTNP
jgi:hypothetical protein